MIRILLIYYSQSGEAQRVAEVLCEGLKDPEVHLTVESLQPLQAYPFPWKRVGAFFNVLPECHWGPAPALRPVRFDPDSKFHLVILVYQVWFLAPSLPIQGFLQSDYARVLKDSKVLTVSVSRKMWQSASETMKRLLHRCRARHMDNIIVTHQGGDWATLITTPRALLFGKKDGFWMFPPVGIGAAELDRVRQLSRTLLRQRKQLLAAENVPLLCNRDAAKVDARFILAERVGWYCFRWWGRRILQLGRMGIFLRRLGVYLFVVFLVCGIPIVMIGTTVIRLLFRPMLRPWMTRYVRELQRPSDP